MLELETGQPLTSMGPLTQPPLIWANIQCLAKPKIQALPLSAGLASVVFFFVSSWELALSGLKTAGRLQALWSLSKYYGRPECRLFKEKMGIMAFLVVDSSLFCLRWSHICGIVHWSTLSSGVNQLYTSEISGTVTSYNNNESGPSLHKYIYKTHLLKTRHFLKTRILRIPCRIWQKCNNLACLVLIWFTVQLRECAKGIPKRKGHLAFVPQLKMCSSLLLLLKCMGHSSLSHQVYSPCCKMGTFTIIF